MIKTAQVNPFLKVKTRWLPLWLVGGLFGVIILLEVFKDVLPQDDTFSSVVSGVSLYVLIAVWVLKTAKRKNVAIGSLVKRSATHIGRFKFVGLVLSILLFSIGAILVMDSILSDVWPRLFLYLTKPDPISNDWRIRKLDFAYQAVSLVVLAPVLEELLFRGILLNRWAEKWGIRKAIVLSSLAFGILHFDIAGAFVFGTCMCLLYLKTESLRYSMCAHALNNSLVFLSSTLPASKGGDTPESYPSFPWFGIIAIAIALPLLLLFLKRNWPAKGALAPYKKVWLSEVLLPAPVEPEVVDYTAAGPIA